MVLDYDIPTVNSLPDMDTPNEERTPEQVNTLSSYQNTNAMAALNGGPAQASLDSVNPQVTGGQKNG